MKRAHTNDWIERDASRPGDISVGRRGAGPQGRRMRRECPNDRRPTRSASAGRLHLPMRRWTTQPATRAPRPTRPLTEPKRSASPRFAPPPRSGDAVPAAVATARSLPVRQSPATRTAMPTTTPTNADESDDTAGPDETAIDYRAGPRRARQSSRRSTATTRTAQADRRGPCHRLRQQSGPSSASRRSATPGRPRQARLRRVAAAKPAQQRGERSRPERQKADKPKVERPAQPAGELVSRRSGGNGCRQEEAPPRRQGPEAGRLARLALDLDADTHRTTSWSRAQRPTDRPLPDGGAGAPVVDPGRRARGPQPDRALRQPAGRRRQPDPRQHLPRPGPERAAGHGGGVRRHRHAEERRALPRRRAVRRRRTSSRSRGQTAHRADAAAQAADHLPGHQEPDRRQGRPAHPGGVAARAGSWC